VIEAMWVAVGLLFVAGLIGALVPLLPGTPLILLGALIYAATTRFAVVGFGRLVVLALIAALAYALEHLAGAVGAKRSGGSRWAVIGALIGGVLGFVIFPVGVVVGPIVGAVIAELLHARNLEQSLRTGVGTLVGALIGAVAHFVLALTMIALFFWWTWPFSLS
jgi:uncharacterized protein